MKGQTIIVVLCLLALGQSRLVRPGHLDEITERDSKLIHPELNQPKITTGPTPSSANPVGGIANATSGYLSVSNTTDSALFYVFYSCRGLAHGQSANTVPILVWLQGGPGASSQLANFMENGPYSLQANSSGIYSESPRAVSWNDHYNMLYIDNPRGVGYSLVDGSDYVTTENQVAADFLQAILNFYQLSTFTQFQNTPLYIFGESYGGHYVPSVTQGLLQYNAAKPSFLIPVKGMGIGDGWTDPVNQLSNNDLFAYSLGLVDTVGKNQITYYQTAGVNNIKNGNWLNALSDFDELMSIISEDGGDLNIYNMRNWGSYDMTPIVTFMNYQDTCNRYNVNPTVCGNFTEINNNVYNALSLDFMQSCASKVAYVVEQLPVLLYNGQDDIIVNTPSAQTWINNMQWSGQSGFHSSAFVSWVLNNGTVAGFNKTYKNLHFNLVNKAGHMAPMDQIESTIEMLHAFIGM